MSTDTGSSLVSRYFLLTYHGYFVGQKEGSRIWLTSHAPVDQESLLSFEFATTNLSTEFAEFLANATSGRNTVSLPRIGEVIMTSKRHRLLVSFEKESKYLAAEPSGALICNRANVGVWEEFLLISQASFEHLQLIFSNAWIISSNRKIVKSADLSIEAGLQLKLGTTRFYLPTTLPLESHFAPFRFQLYRDGWKFDEILLYRPLIYYVAKGSYATEQLFLSLKSLVKFGGFNGQVLVYTDLSAAQILESVSELTSDQIQVRQHPAKDRVGFVMGRFSVLDEPFAHDHAPVVYMDCDIIYNNNIQSLLVDMTCSAGPSAPVEHFSRLSVSPSVGAELLQLDNERPELACGFNAGTFAVPNLKHFGYIWNIMRRIAQSFLALHGRESLRFVDQEVANYLSYKYSPVYTHEVSKYVRWGWSEDGDRLGVLSGLVHFWGVDRNSRSSVMKNYLKILERHYDPG
ncbi:hypothetical protein [Methylobacterium soli]|uniref:Uncharacterized protein n=1 Tax=Methylobacterium soli TaxID=553447 RepID=A0A6L3SP17_9HYPH|nr:hypothetical protein [Methylobacterium soli]KAB1070365.1 hypothetical protein F6X53_30180 [Methylobacterium soli]GJE41256.1 hypothetical protein AEGHOMDF_0418 [Methylobacterium soli]